MDKNLNKVVYNSCFGGFALSAKAIDWLAERGHKGAIKHKKNGFSRPGDIVRHDPLLVECIEMLGTKASGPFSNLGIAVIEGSQYRIEKYDGREFLETPDSITFITID